MIWKDGKTHLHVVDNILRKYLIRCYRTVNNYYLINLRNNGRIRIELFNKTTMLIACRIVELNSAKR